MIPTNEIHAALKYVSQRNNRGRDAVNPTLPVAEQGTAQSSSRHFLLGYFRESCAAQESSGSWETSTGNKGCAHGFHVLWVRICWPSSALHRTLCRCQRQPMESRRHEAVTSHQLVLVADITWWLMDYPNSTSTKLGNIML